MGTRSALSHNADQSADHPHACGDKMKQTPQKNCSVGSSPRVWGQDASSAVIPNCFRIIPTRMGTRICEISTENRIKDHPHAYGDKSVKATLEEALFKSSPRVWGQVCTLDLNDYCTRIIPTRMGTSQLFFRGFRLAEDHPHAYGDKTATLSKGGKIQGSSPCVWGQGLRRISDTLCRRIIPTRMGTRVFCFCSDCYAEDHPHAYGDKERIQALRVLQ